jgi:alkanesulfonate monooxygenase SsuD/methylene tetrahydromethanopterin reductase-like flavin-dependent oxidoreductase (luciferase family)
MRIGLFAGAVPSGDTLAQQVDELIEAERRGFEGVFLAQVAGADVLTMLALAGPETERIELGTGVVPTYTRHPNVLAQQAITVNAATAGRLALGIGPSHRPGVERLGLEYDRPALHIREYVQLVRALSTEGRVAFEGDYYHLTTAINLAGAQPFPILISALAPLMLRVAGEVADGTITWMADATALQAHVWGAKQPPRPSVDTAGWRTIAASSTEAMARSRRRLRRSAPRRRCRASSRRTRPPARPTSWRPSSRSGTPPPPR